MENTGILVTIIISIVLLTLFLAGIVFVIRSVRRNRRTGVMDEMEGHEFGLLRLHGGCGDDQPVFYGSGSGSRGEAAHSALGQGICG